MELDQESRAVAPATADPALMTEWSRGEYVVSTSRDRVALAVVHGFLASSYWAKGIAYDTVRGSVEHSLPFGVYRASVMVGFAPCLTCSGPAAGRTQQ